VPGIDFTHAPTWLQWVIIGVIILGALATIIGFVRKAWPVLSKFVTTITALDDLPRFIVEQDDFRTNINTTIQRMNHELSPNGGTSLVDRSKRNEAAIEEILDGQRHVKSQLAAVKTTIARTDKALTTHLAESAVILERLEASGQIQPKDKS
jgi:hypothetical protein